MFVNEKLTTILHFVVTITSSGFPLTVSSSLQPARPAGRAPWFRKLLFVALSGIVAAYAFHAFTEQRRKNVLRMSRASGEITGSVSDVSTVYGPSGLALPRFVTLKSAKVNVRRGPSSDHAVAWVFQRKGLPVEITAEFENWRRIRDSDGQEGWILQQMLSGKRNAVAMPLGEQKTVSLHEDPDTASSVVAQMSQGAMGDIEDCDGQWCRLNAAGYEGYIDQSRVWGAYPGEVVD
jgi:SH3-like domain-containing protein